MPLSSRLHVRGLLLAAGSGSRMGGPKALLRPDPDGPTWVERAVEVLLAGGCEGVTVVVGAQAQAVTDALSHDSIRGDELEVVRCEGWAEGMGASLRAGLVALQREDEVDAVLVTLVDLPDVGPDVVRRLLSSTIERTASGQDLPPSTIERTASRQDMPSSTIERTALGQWRGELSRAAYGGVPGHPTLIGRDHWDGVIAVARGDRGARDYLRSHPHHLVECGDLARGHDVDSLADLDS